MRSYQLVITETSEKVQVDTIWKHSYTFIYMLLTRKIKELMHGTGV